MTKNYEGILVDKKDGVATLTLNRPEKMNPLSPPLMGEIIEAMDEIAADPDVTVLVITGAGRAFTAGADLNWFGGPKKSPDPVEGYRRYHMSISIEEKLRLYPKTTIAAINGFALGWGFWLAMLCDFAVMAEDAWIGVPEVNIAFFPAGGTIKSMLTFVPHRDALYHLLTGDNIGAEEADKLRLVNKVVPKAELMDEAYKLADIMKKKDPVIVRFVKRAFWREKYMNYADAIDLESMQGAQASGLRPSNGGPTGIDALRAEKAARNRS